jgi:Uma2 family endonuclease
MLDIQPLPITPTARRFPRVPTPVNKTFAILPTQDDLPSEDNVPMETEPHRLQMELLIDTLRPWLASHGGGYVSGNMFVYFSPAHSCDEDVLGPDVFVVLGVPDYERKKWVVWEEGQGPDVVIELLSHSTAKHDQDQKKQIYQDRLKVAEYFWFDPWNTDDWAGFERINGRYRKMATKANTRLLSKKLGLMLVRWQGVYKRRPRTWLRWATLDGKLLPTAEELANVAEQRATTAEVAQREAEHRAAAESLARQEAEHRAAAESLARQEAEHRAELEMATRRAAEAEVARLTALLAQQPK